MADISVRLGQQSDISVRLGQQNAIKVVSSNTARGVDIALSDLTDVNALSPSNGMVLVYNGFTNKWDATLTLTPGSTQNLDINGGSF